MRRELLYSSIGALYVTAQFITTIRVEAFPFLPDPYNLVPGGVIAYLSIFVIANILNEKEGRREGLKVMIVGLFANLLYLVNLYIEGALPEAPASSSGFPEYTSQTYQWFLNTQPRIIAGSVMAFVVAMYVNNTLYHRLRWNIYGKYVAAVVIAMAIDTALFHAVAFSFIFTLEGLLGSIFSVTALKIILTVVSIPIFAFGLRGYAWMSGKELRVAARAGA